MSNWLCGLFQLAQVDVGESSSKHRSKQEEGHIVQTTHDSETGNGAMDVTFPHGTCHSNSDDISSSILHPSTEQCNRKNCPKNNVKVC